jgi:hypothetical protein
VFNQIFARKSIRHWSVLMLIAIAYKSPERSRNL